MAGLAEPVPGHLSLLPEIEVLMPEEDQLRSHVRSTRKVRKLRALQSDHFLERLACHDCSRPWGATPRNRDLAAENFVRQGDQTSH